ncbi:hypothetical protein Ancab_024452 [Ancistrocladus abbreviatus]
MAARIRDRGVLQTEFFLKSMRKQCRKGFTKLEDAVNVFHQFIGTDAENHFAWSYPMRLSESHCYMRTL